MQFIVFKQKRKCGLLSKGTTTYWLRKQFLGEKSKSSIFKSVNGKFFAIKLNSEMRK